MTREPAAARTAFLDAGAFFAGLAEEIHPHEWTRPALGTWDVRALVGHTHRALVTLAGYLGAPADDELCTGTGQYYVLAAAAARPEEVAARGVAAGQELGRCPEATVPASHERARAALEQVPPGADPVIRTPVGGTRLSAYLPTRTFELTVHGMDVAAACGWDVDVPAHVHTDAALTAVEIAGERGQAPPVLQALTGRRPLPPGFSVLARAAGRGPLAQARTGAGRAAARACGGLGPMRIVLQRVTRAAVTVEGTVVGRIEEAGLVALVGVTHDDDASTAAKLAERTWNLRLLEGERSCAELGAPVLAVSQFTLYGDARRGRRPSWSAAAPGPVSEPLFEAYVQALRELGARVETGRFGAVMQVELVNDGPVTLVLDTEELGRPRRS